MKTKYYIAGGPEINVTFNKEKATIMRLGEAEFRLTFLKNAHIEKIDNTIPDGEGRNYILIIK